MDLTRKMRQGMGVSVWTLMRAMDLGMRPPLAPTKNSRELAKMPPLTEPNVEQATNRGITNAIGPKILFPKV